MADQPARLEAATVRAEVGSNIVYRFANDAAMQLLRVEIRMAADTEGAILNIEAQVSELINEERAELEG